MHICLGWNFYLSTCLMLVITALYTIAGTAPARRRGRGCGKREAGGRQRATSSRLGRGRREADGGLPKLALRPRPRPQPTPGDRAAAGGGTPPASCCPPAGGLAAVIYTDALQTLIMVVGAVILTVKGERLAGSGCCPVGAQGSARTRSGGRQAPAGLPGRPPPICTSVTSSGPLASGCRTDSRSGLDGEVGLQAGAQTIRRLQTAWRLPRLFKIT